MLLEQVKSLNLPLFQSLPLLVAMASLAQRVLSHPPQRSITERELPLLCSLNPPPLPPTPTPVLLRNRVMIFPRFSPRSTTRLLMLAPVPTVDVI